MFTGLLSLCAIIRINHVAKTISLNASRMPVRLEVFLQFSFSNIVFMFLLNYTCSILCSRNSRKAFKFLSKRLVLLSYGNHYRNLCFVHKTTYLWSMRSLGGGELSLSACPGVGNRPPSENKIANPRGNARGGMVTGRIEPCIRQNWKQCWDSMPKHGTQHALVNSSKVRIFSEADRN